MIEINWLGVLIATVAGMVLGALWYSPLLFGNRWMKCLGKTPETIGSATLPMIGSVLACSLSATGVAILFSLVGASTLADALSLGAVLGLFIIFPALLSDNLFCGWGNTLLLIQSGYRITSVLFMSVIIYWV